MGIIDRLQQRQTPPKQARYPRPPSPDLVKLGINPTLVGSYYTTSLSGVWEDRPWYQLVDANKGWVYTAVDKIAKSIAMIPLKLFVYRNSTGKKVMDPKFKVELKSFKTAGAKEQFLRGQNLIEESITDHPFLDLIHKPNTYLTRFYLWYDTMIRLELGGICGWLLLRDKLGVPREIHTLPLTKFARLRARVTREAVLEGWHYEDGEVFVDFQTEDLIVMRYAHAASPWQGYGALQSQTFAYDIDLFASEQQRSFFRNGAALGQILSTDQKLTPDQRYEIQRQIEDQYTGAMKAGGTLVTHSGIKPVGKGTVPGRDSSIKDIFEIAREKILPAFDMSDGSVGLVHDVNRANMDGIREQFIMDCVQPKTMLIEEAIEEFMLPQYDPSLTLEFDLPYIGNQEFDLKKRESNLKTGYSTINEERVSDGKSIVPWGDKPWFQLNMAQVGSEPPKPPGGGGEDRDQEDGTEEDEEEGAKPKEFKIDPSIERGILLRLKEKSKAIEGQYAGWSRKKIEAHLKTNKDVDYILDGA
jgi:hypothetical protein